MSRVAQGIDLGRAARDVVLRALLAFAALVAITAVWGRWLQERGPGIDLHAAPLFGRWHVRPTALVLVTIVAAILALRHAPRLADRLSWRSLLWASAVGAAGWGVALALNDGLHGLTMGVTDAFEYLADLDRVGAPGPFLQAFTERIGGYVVHVRSHPPGMIVGLWWLDRLGLGGPGWAAAVMIAAGAAAVPAALLAVRDVAGERPARLAAPFLVLAPAAIWRVTSGDALFAGVAAWGIALLVLATGRRDRIGDLQALGGGLLLGAGLHLSYGLVPILAIPVAVAVWRRRLRPLAIGAAGALAVTALFVANGFWWFEGLRETHREYAEGVAARRPYAYFVFANLAAFGIAVGPGAVAGLPVLRERRVWLLVGGGLVAVLLADLSGLSKAEVERIWLPFVPWVGLAAAALPRRLVGPVLGLQVAGAVALQVVLETLW